MKNLRIVWTRALSYALLAMLLLAIGGGDSLGSPSSPVPLGRSGYDDEDANLDAIQALVTAPCAAPPPEGSDDQTRYGPLPPSSAVIDDLYTVIFRPRCMPPEAILWYKNGTAVQVNPYYLSRALILALEELPPRGEVRFVLSRLVSEHVRGIRVKWPTTNVLSSKR